MAQISTIGSLPNPSSHIQSGQVKSASPNSLPKAAPAIGPSAGIPADEALSSPLQAQLTRFSGVLSGLQKNASILRAQYLQTYHKVKSGTYNIDSSDVSRSMVNELLAKQ